MSGKSWISPLVKFNLETGKWEISGNDAAKRVGTLTLLIDGIAKATTVAISANAGSSDAANGPFRFSLDDEFPEGGVRQVNVQRSDGSWVLNEPVSLTFSRPIPPPKVNIRESDGSVIVDVSCANSRRPISYDLIVMGKKLRPM